jgi:hypothetical protein
MRQNALRRCVAVVAGVAFLWTVALTVAPRLHQRVHGGESRGDHSCAVTFLRSGSYHHAAAPAFRVVAHFTAKFAILPELTSCWVPSPFLGAAIFEHGPPSAFLIS